MNKAASVRWYRLPVAWLGIGIFAASLVGCVCVLLLAAHYPDEPLTVDEQVFKVPAKRGP